MRVAERGALPYLGVRRPDIRRIARAAAQAHPVDPATMHAVVVELWDAAEFCEERYAAQDLVALPWSRGRLDLLDLRRHMAVTGAWWDHVDEVAHRIADLVETRPEEMGAVLRSWSRDEVLWLRRLAIIGQLTVGRSAPPSLRVGRRDRVDLQLLADVIEPNLADPEFFIRKAIGWALREVARWNPDRVRTFADTTT
jgi:3-methyladenine DNA glycosylase AlkD